MLHVKFGSLLTPIYETHLDVDIHVELPKNLLGSEIVPDIMPKNCTSALFVSVCDTKGGKIYAEKYIISLGYWF